MKDEQYLGQALVFQTHELLKSAGYKLIDDAWKSRGRYTFLHEEDATRDYVRSLNRIIKRVGWTPDARKLRAFRHIDADHEIELEPGGAGVTGHFLHHMKRRASQKC